MIHVLNRTRNTFMTSFPLNTPTAAFINLVSVPSPSHMYDDTKERPK